MDLMEDFIKSGSPIEPSSTWKLCFTSQAREQRNHYVCVVLFNAAESEEVRPGVVLDFDAQGQVLGIEMLDVSKRTDKPRELVMELIGDW